MNLSLARIKKLFPNFNRVAITEDEIWKIAKREKIIIKMLPLPVDGYYQVKRGKHYILINSHLSPVRWLHTVCHELCHYLFDEPTEVDNFALYRGGPSPNDRRERRADAFALIAMMPLEDLKRLSKEDLSDNPWLANIVRDRVVVYTEVGM